MKYKVSYIMDGKTQSGTVVNLKDFLTGLYIAVFKVHKNISGLTIKGINT